MAASVAVAAMQSPQPLLLSCYGAIKRCVNDELVNELIADANRRYSSRSVIEPTGTSTPQQRQLAVIHRRHHCAGNAEKNSARISSLLRQNPLPRYGRSLLPVTCETSKFVVKIRRFSVRLYYVRFRSGRGYFFLAQMGIFSRGDYARMHGAAAAYLQASSSSAPSSLAAAAAAAAGGNDGNKLQVFCAAVIAFN